MSGAPRGFPMFEDTSTRTDMAAVEFQLQRDDLVDGYVHLVLNSPRMRRLRWRNFRRASLVLLIVALSFGLIVGILHGPGAQQIAQPIFVALGYWLFLVLVLMLGLIRPGHGAPGLSTSYRALVRDPSYDRILLPIRAQVTRDNYTETSAVKQTSVRWEGFESIEANPKVMYLSMGPAGSFIVPRRAFTDDAAWEFVRLARQFHEAASTGRAELSLGVTAPQQAG